MLIQQHLESYTRKPNAGYVKSQIMDNGTQKDVTPQELAQILMDGYSIIPAEMEGNGSANDSMWKSQQIFMVDVDNDKPDKLHLTLEEILAKCSSNGLLPSFIYETFSSTEANRRYRAVFTSNCPITDSKLRDDVLFSFFSILSDGKMTACDVSCIDESRIFYGGKKIVFENYDSKFEVENVTKLKNDAVLKVVGNYKNHISIYNNTLSFSLLPNPLKDMSIIELQDFVDQKPKVFPSYKSMMEFFTKEVDLHQLLGVSGHSFCCPFHDDKHPSAGIFRTESGEWFFNCFGCGKKGNILGVTEIARSLTRMEAVEFLKEVFQASYKESQNVLMLQENLRMLESGEIEYSNPELYDVYHRYSEVLEKIHSIAIENAHHNNDSEETIFFLSHSHLMKRLKRYSKSYSSTRVALLAFLKLCTKVPDDQVPEQLMKKAEEFRVLNGHEDTIQFYRIPSYKMEHLAEAEQRAITYKESRMTMAGMSRELILRTCGEEIADEVYPKLKGEDLPKGADIFQGKVEAIMNKLVARNGYCTEKDILKKLDGDYRYNSIRLKRCIQESMDKYGYKKRKSSSCDKEQYGIKSKGFPIIIVKESE